MKRFKEKDLNENLEEFKNNRDIEIAFENDITGILTIEKATVKYDEKYGYIKIKGVNTNIQINTTLINKYEKNEEAIFLYLDTLKIKIKNKK